ncbi:hypothetical protein CerSpe_247860 [Prunus speciosa]
MNSTQTTPKQPNARNPLPHHHQATLFPLLPPPQPQSLSFSHHNSFHSLHLPNPKSHHFPILSTKTTLSLPLQSLKPPSSPTPHSDFQEKVLYLDSIGLDFFSLINHHPPPLSPTSNPLSISVSTPSASPPRSSAASLACAPKSSPPVSPKSSPSSPSSSVRPASTAPISAASLIDAPDCSPAASRPVSAPPSTSSRASAFPK